MLTPASMVSSKQKVLHDLSFRQAGFQRQCGPLRHVGAPVSQPKHVPQINTS